MVGGVQWELIHPLDQESVYARFLAEKGEGVHHVAVATSDFDEIVAQADRRNGVLLRGQFAGADVAYLDSKRELGVIFEIFKGHPAGRPGLTTISISPSSVAGAERCLVRALEPQRGIVFASRNLLRRWNHDLGSRLRRRAVALPCAKCRVGDGFDGLAWRGWADRR